MKTINFKNLRPYFYCQKKKRDSIVELTLPADSNIYASEYSLYLPDKALLQSKLTEWTAEFEEAHGGIEE
jgi:hypothetical protein